MSQNGLYVSSMRTWCIFSSDYTFNIARYFKATLFLQSGSIVKRFNIPKQASAKDAYGWIVMGRVLAIIVGISVLDE